MKKAYRSVVAVMIAFAIVIGTLFCNTIDSHATYLEASVTDKIIDIPIIPYGGLTVEDAFTHSGSGGYSHTQMYMKTETIVVEKSTGKELIYTDKIEAGKTYTVTLTLQSYQGNLPEHVKIRDFSCNIFNYSDSSDKTFVSNIKKEVDGDYYIKLTFDVAVTVRPVFNQGTLDFSFTKDVTSIDGSNPAFVYLVDYLYSEKYYGRISRLAATDNSYYDFDLNNDGKYDLRVNLSSELTPISLSRLTESDISGDYSYVMSKEDCNNFEKRCKFYYEKLNLHFSELDSNNSTNNSGDNNTSDDNNNSNNNSNNSNDSNSNNTNNNSNNSNSNNQNNGSNDSSKNSDTNNNSGNNSSNGSNDSATGITYENEWVNGQWYGTNGDTSYTPQGSWKSNSTGWWFEDTAGWYPQSQWVKIDGKWYYFTADGYMDYSEYRDGCWLGSDGAWVEEYYGGHWGGDSTGWWYEDSSGWYPANQWLWIDGYRYWFNSSGYWSE